MCSHLLFRIASFSLFHRFPLHSLEKSNKMLADEAVESFGISIPLLEFRSIRSQCPDKFPVTLGNDDGLEEGEDEDDIDDGSSNDQAVIKKESGKTSLVTTDGKSILEFHPYVVTR
jgi:hypothetical protein